MTDRELLQLRQTADRDGDLTASARVLFGEIINLNLLGDGCYKAYTTLASDLGMNERTVRRRRDELEEAGYVRVSHDGDRRYLVPTRPDSSNRTGHERPDIDAEADTSDRTDATAPDTDDETPPDTSVQDRDIYNPAEAQESAPARGDGSSDASPRDDDPPGVKIWMDVTGERPNIATRKQLKEAFDGPESPRWDGDTFRKALREAWLNVDQKAHRIRIGYLLTSYEQHLTRGGDSVPDPDVELNPRGYPIR